MIFRIGFPNWFLFHHFFYGDLFLFLILVSKCLFFYVTQPENTWHKGNNGAIKASAAISLIVDLIERTILNFDWMFTFHVIRNWTADKIQFFFLCSSSITANIVSMFKITFSSFSIVNASYNCTNRLYWVFEDTLLASHKWKTVTL